MQYLHVSRAPPVAVDFDGSSYLSKASGLTGAANTKVGTVSFWAKMDADGVDETFFHGYDIGTGGNFRIFRATTNRILVVGTLSGSGTINLLLTSANTVTASLGWFHYMASWDMANASNRHIYINGADAFVDAATYNNNNNDMTLPLWALGRNVASASNYDGGIADFMFWHDTYTDLSDAGNRAAFYAGGPVPASRAVTLVGDPDVQFSGPWADWKTNKGTGGAFTETGTLTETAFTL